MAGGGKRPGAGRPPAGGEVRRLIREAAGILAAGPAALDLTAHRIARGELAHEEASKALEAVAKVVAAGGMMASRRLLAAARAFTLARARAVFCDCGHEEEDHFVGEGRCEIDKCACERFTLER